MAKEKKVQKPVKESTPAVKKAGLIVSRLNHTVTLAYSDSTIQIPPNGREKVENIEMLGAIPKGIQVIRL